MCVYMCVYIYIGWVYRCLCNMCDGSIPYKSSGLMLLVCVHVRACVWMSYDACIFTCMSLEVHVGQKGPL